MALDLEGYYRTEEETAWLLVELMRDLAEHPELRLGELIISALGANKITAGAIFEMSDRSLIDQLRAWRMGHPWSH